MRRQKNLADVSAIRPYHLVMDRNVAIVGAGVSGLTCGVVFAERGHRTAIFAKESGQQTTSAAAAAIWFPYDAQPTKKVIPWALKTYQTLAGFSSMPASGVSMVELRQFSRISEIQISDWAISLGAQRLSVAAALRAVADQPQVRTLDGFVLQRTGGYSFRSGFALTVPLMDTTIYLDYLANRFVAAGGSITSTAWLEKPEDVDSKFDLVINCAGIGARELVHDRDLEPHRGQVAVVPRIEGLSCAIVCDDAPLMYAIPRTNDCVFGGTNEISDNLAADHVTTSEIVAECSRVLSIDPPRVLAERVGLRPFRKSGVRLESGRLGDGRTVIHNYGHGGAGFTLSWGCAHEVLETSTL